jgi:hypothetical protein
MDIFVVETPLQMLNAIEARFYFNGDRNLLILLTSPPFPQKIFKPLIDRNAWDGIFSIPIREKEPEFVSHPDFSLWERKFGEYYRYLKQFKCRRKLNMVTKSFTKVDRLFLGNYLQEYMRHFGNHLDYRELVLLDDGNDAVRVNDLRWDRAVEVKPRGVAGFKAGLHKLLHDWDSRHANNVTFFSSYDLAPKNGDRLVKNGYAYLRKMIGANAQTDQIMFLGQCLVDDQWMSKAVYLEYLARIKQYFAEEQLIYIKHPRESKPILDEIRGRLGFEILWYDVPIEFQLVRGVVPKGIASFFCSAIENCRIIFGSSLCITAFYIEPRDLLCCHGFAEQMYAYWKSKENQRFRVRAA